MTGILDKERSDLMAEQKQYQYDRFRTIKSIWYRDYLRVHGASIVSIERRSVALTEVSDVIVARVKLTIFYLRVSNVDLGQVSDAGVAISDQLIATYEGCLLSWYVIVKDRAFRWMISLLPKATPATLL